MTALCLVANQKIQSVVSVLREGQLGKDPYCLQEKYCLHEKICEQILACLGPPKCAPLCGDDCKENGGKARGNIFVHI